MTKNFSVSNTPSDDQTRMLQAVGLWLRTQGWTPFVISALRIEAQYGFNYELVLRITGKPPEGCFQGTSAIPAESVEGVSAFPGEKK